MTNLIGPDLFVGGGGGDGDGQHRSSSWLIEKLREREMPWPLKLSPFNQRLC